MGVWHCAKCKASIPSLFIECKFCGSNRFDDDNEGRELKEAVQEKRIGGFRKEAIHFGKM